WIYEKMVVFTGKKEALDQLGWHVQLAFIGNCTEVAKGMSTRSLPPTDQYTLAFENIQVLRGILEDTTHFHYMQTGGGAMIMSKDGKTSTRAPDPKKPQTDKLYLALLTDTTYIRHLIEIQEEDVEEIKQIAAASPPT
ncbi:unnamed protein product, partial [Didymodactylos carnosus]